MVTSAEEFEAEAIRCLHDAADPAIAPSDTATAIAVAQVYATLAVAAAMERVADALDGPKVATLPPSPEEVEARAQAAWNYRGE